MVRKTLPIYVRLMPSGMSQKPVLLIGDLEDERAICILAEEMIREEMSRGNGIGYYLITCWDAAVERRIRTYLAGVSHEIQTWPGERISS